MELDELFAAWKRQDQYIDQHLKMETFSYLFKQKSKGVLSQIIKNLVLELIVLLFLLLGFNALFFMVELPFSAVRWICFAIFNAIAIVVLSHYAKTIYQVRRAVQQNVCSTLEKIIHHLKRFRAQSNYFNAPVGVIGIMMFAGSQGLLYWLPWLILEFLLWRWLLIPKINKRFESYIADLEYSLSTMVDIKAET
ncbi:MAG: hypothetical protein AAF632_28325 [Bacteroidota bacterium]